MHPACEGEQETEHLKFSVFPPSQFSEEFVVSRVSMPLKMKKGAMEGVELWGIVQQLQIF